MTDRDRLRDAVVQAARDVVQPRAPLGSLMRLQDALAALDAHPAQRATAETVGVAVWENKAGFLSIARSGSDYDRLPTKHWTRLGTTTLRLDTEAAG